MERIVIYEFLVKVYYKGLKIKLRWLDEWE